VQGAAALLFSKYVISGSSIFRWGWI